MTEITLTDWREELGYSVNELACELNIEPNDLRNWEADWSACPIQRVIELALDGLEAKKALNEVKAESAGWNALDRFEAWQTEKAALEKERIHRANFDNTPYDRALLAVHREMVNMSQNTAVWKEGDQWIGAIIHTQAEVITRAKTQIAAEADLEETMRKRGRR